MHLLIQNAVVVNADHCCEADILVEGRVIKKIAPKIEPLAGVQTLDASGLMAFPGGVDPHVHMHLPTAAGYSSDNFESGSRAALLGGTTTLLDFVTPSRGMSLTKALELRLQEAEKCMTDYSFHVSPVEWTKNTEEEIQEVIRLGVTSFKVYMAYKDSIGVDETTLKKIMGAVAGGGGTLAVHCEMGDEIQSLREDLSQQGRNGPPAHAASRPPHTESHAVARAISLARETGCRLYVVHTSTKESKELIAQARKMGQMVWGEVTPHHLLLDSALYYEAFERAAPFVLSPPLRSAEHRNALWRGIAEGNFQTVGTDHCPFSMEQKMLGKNDFRLIANGAGGVEHRLALLYTFGVLPGRISPMKMVDLLAASPARIFGLYPQKGVIRQGSDADIVLWDPLIRKTISASTHHQRNDNSIYEGVETQGALRAVILGGNLVADSNGMLRVPKGRFLKRPTPGLQNP